MRSEDNIPLSNSVLSGFSGGKKVVRDGGIDRCNGLGRSGPSGSGRLGTAKKDVK